MPSIASTLHQATLRLGGASPQPEARLDAEILLCLIMDCPRSYLHTWPERELDAQHAQCFMTLIERRATGEPLAYLTGRWEFWSMVLEVTPDTLIPRPDTELLVELALQRIPMDGPSWHIADLGTGSGAIALAIASERPACHVIATDRATAALTVAQRNATNLNIHNIEFREGHWLAPLQGETFHLIASNPPYISSLDLRLSTSDIRFEPLSALASGIDGLDDIRIIAETARQHLVTGGWLLLEHGYDQGDATLQILRNLGYQEICGHRDFAGMDRVVSGRAPA